MANQHLPAIRTVRLSLSTDRNGSTKSRQDNGLPAPTLFALCLRQLALWPKVDVSSLPPKLEQKVENLRASIKTFEAHYLPRVKIDPSMYHVLENGELDWSRLCCHRCNSLHRKHLFRFMAISGFSVRNLWQELSREEQDELLASSNDLIRNTALLMRFRNALPLLKYSSIRSAAEDGLAGAVRAWIGIQDDKLNNVSYEELDENDNEDNHITEHRRQQQSMELSKEQDTGYAVLLSIFHGHYHMLRYLSVRHVIHSFLYLFPDGRVPLFYFRHLAQPPAIECRLNNELPAQLEYIARMLLCWMPRLDIQRLRQEATEVEDFVILEFIEHLMTNITESEMSVIKAL